ncbi:carbohydrate-binding protein (plasmid) [Haloferax mediterranei ATCC 33500]|uniref:Alpha-glucosidase n=1 Tax=Haloferax mediterranei (strain ATCC 33500 / DSM 1411 / JCM 8866 / NBRC 14739 / NCIMB 2177 / R-4) TaxID=523841 RepID=I3RAI8_HALMT|nr:glycoside hydrolase family 97 catalytic domain-containing protein [Haloferax mediterranei]AFK21248.1 alpha-glucosidase [Haloferax mediterranei ATCC 33500]ELZ97422.1 alpha-glucosidase [Haloferax mediterranei ATCC 33500]MDX5990283.1 glycoside hydrolase family 97 catalytic domain-containing protein [Haloferax mediterranei ATCC 33500]QCQ77046.1 carbohydrate-binding protein [Haloferax mediterranei ATCC 33500]
MSDREPQTNDDRAEFGRRQFLGGLTSLAAAASYTLDVPDTVASTVSNSDDELAQTISSPDGAVAVEFDVSSGTPTYTVSYDGRTVVEPSSLGFEFDGQPAFGTELTVTGTERSAVDDRWTPVWDQYNEIREHYNELRVGLAETTSPERALTVAIRVFDDGLGLRYVFPEDSGFGDFVITAERTEFAFGGDYTAWWIENDFNSYEYGYKETPLSEIGERSPFGGAHTPMTIQADDETYLSIHEASLVDYAAMGVEPTSSGGTAFESTLAPLPDGTKVAATAPHATPWRTIQVGSRPGDLVESNLIVNLNEPHDPADFPHGTDWIEPQKFLGVWWLMITGRADWEYRGPETGNHGAQTKRMKRYMDFASEHDIPSVLVEGWNEGWSTYPGDGSAMDFDESYPDFDIEEVTDYGRALNPPVRMTAHNETAGNISNYESQLTSDSSSPFAYYDSLGIHSIKTGYVADSGVSIDGETYNHHCQPLVNHHRLVYREAAKHRQMLEIHEPLKPTGERRTFPNVMTREGVLGQEYDSFGRVGPSHHVTFPFTRMLGGPVEYTPGIFDMDSGSGGIETTRAKQLAMYPTYFSGLQMVSDLPSSYLADRDTALEVGSVTQAEDAERNGFATAAKWAGAFGGKYVPVDPNTVDHGASLSWPIENVPSAGEYDLHFRYASDATNNAVPEGTPRTATVLVDGDAQKQATFPPTAYWDEWNAISVRVSLSAGANTVTLTLGDDDTGGFNLDSVAVTEPDSSMPEPETDPTRRPTVDAFDFIESVPAGPWDDTRVLDAEIGSYSVIARKRGDEWFVGAMTDENGRALDISLDFLDSAPGQRDGHASSPGKSSGKGHRSSNGKAHENATGLGHTKGKYVAELYSDGVDVAYGSNPNLEPVRVDEAIVTADTTLLASMAETGGTAIRLKPATSDDLERLPTYQRPEQDIEISIRDNPFVRESFVTATGSNSGDYIGGTTVEIVVDGENVATSNVRFPPHTTDQQDTLSYAIDTPGTYEVTVRTANGQTLTSETVTVKPPETVAKLSDPTGDDDGPGAYTYPTNGAFKEGAFDLQSVTVEQTPGRYQVTFEVEDLYNAFGSGRGFSPQLFLLWVRDPNKDGGTDRSLDDLGATVSFEDSWHYRLEVSGFTKSAVDATGAALSDESGNAITLQETVDRESNTVTLTFDRAAFDGVDAGTLEVVAAVQSEDRGSLRPVKEERGAYVFGGAKSGAVDDAPLIADLIVPDGDSQATVLDYADGDPATLPYVALE